MILNLLRRRPAATRRICVIHAGLPKTGTSSLQAFLARNDRALARSGVLFPEAGRDNKGIQHGDLMREMSDRPIFKGNSHMLADLDREVDRRDHEVLLLSSEYTYSPLYILGNTQIQDRLRAKGYALHVVTYLRDQPALMNSFYSQLTKSLREHRPFDEFLRDRLNPHRAPGRVFRMANFLKHAGDWGTHHFQPYDDEVRRQGIEPHFMGVLRGICAAEGVAAGLTAEAVAAFAPVERMNETCGPIQLAAARILAAELAPRFDQPALARATVGVIEVIAAETAAAGVAERAYAGLTPGRIRRIRAALAEDNDAFARQVWGATWAERLPDAPGARAVSNDIADTGEPEARRLAAAIADRARPKIEALVARRVEKGLV